MAELTEYIVEINGIEHTMLLTEKDAELRNARKAGSAPTNQKSAAKRTKASDTGADSE
jgi:hypothetical protein